MAGWISDLGADETGIRAALLEVAEDVSDSGTWACELATGNVVCSANTSRIFGLPHSRSPVALSELIAQTHPDDKGQLDGCLDRVQTWEAHAQARYRVITAAGTTRFVHAVVAARLSRPAGPVVVGWVHDVTEWRTAEREIAARAAVTDALTSWEDVDRGAPRVLAALAEPLGFSRGVLWIPAGTDLVTRATWEQRHPRPLNAQLRPMRLTRAEGLAGQAWQTGELVTVTDLEDDAGYPFRDAALEHGLRGAVAVPIRWLDETIAVIGLAGTERLELSERLRGLLLGVAHELGTFLAKRRGELRGSKLSRRELEVLQLAADGMTGPEIAARLHVSPATVKTHFERIYVRYGVPDRVAAVAKAVREGLIK